VGDVTDVVQKDNLFYRNSNGGVTFSGGEPTYQAAFLLELLKESRRKGFHTCLDTSGYTPWEVLEEILEHVDLVLFDVKHMDPQKHMELTGVDNRLILRNAKRIVETGNKIVIRVPLLPEVNDSDKNINALGNFMSELSVKRVDLLPYHRLGVKKYERLGMEYKLRELRSFKREEVDGIKGILENFGLDVDIV
jgi:pyruvate formate lyase activating enzyme